jgi:phage-related protein
VQIIPKAEGITSKMNSLLGGAGKSAGGKAGKEAGDAAGLKLLSSMKKALTAAAIGAPIVAGIKTALSQGSELEQNLGGTEAVFGNFASTIQSKAQTAYKNMGMSASDYMATANKMGSLFQGSGVDQRRALSLTSDAMQRAADVASVMGLDTASAMESIAGAAKGNFTMMDNLGVAMNATTLQAYALEKGMNFKWETASNAEKAELAMQMFMDRTSQYAGNFARESQETFSGSFGAMQAAASNFLANLTLHRGIEGPLRQLISTTSDFLFGNLLPMIGNVFSSLPFALGSALSTAGPLIMEKAPELINNLVTGIQSAIPKLMSFGSTIINTIRDAITANAPAIKEKGSEILSNIGDGIVQGITTIYEKGGEIVSNLINGIGANAPNVGAGIESLINSAVTFLETNLPIFGEKGGEMVGKIAEAIITNAPAILAAIGRLIVAIGKGLIKLVPVALTAARNMLAGLGNGIKAGWSAIQPHVTALVNKITTPIRTLVTKVRTIMNNVKSAMQSVWNSIKSAAGTAFNAIKSKMTEPIEKAKSTVKSIMDKIKGFFPLSIGRIFSNFHLPHLNVSGGTPPYGIGGMGSLPHFSVDWYAKGGVFDAASVIGVGEAGREAVVPLSGQYMRPFAEAIASEMSGSGSTNNYINITVDGAENPEDYARRLARELQLVMRTA